MAEGLDFSWSRPGPAAIKAAGRVFVCRYLGPARFGGKGLSSSELQGYLAAGISVVLNFESSGQNTTSFANGVADAKYANGEAAALGYPNAVIYFSNDKQDVTGLVDYFRGVESVIGHGRTGVYGGIGAIQILQGSGLASFYWQTYAWSGGRVASGVHIYQYRNGQTINGASVDFDRSLQANFGQIGSGAPTDVNVQPFDPNTNASEEEDMFTIYNNGGSYMIVGSDIFLEVGQSLTNLTGVDGAETVNQFLAAGAKQVQLDPRAYDVLRVNIRAGRPVTSVDANALAAALQAAGVGGVTLDQLNTALSHLFIGIKQP